MSATDPIVMALPKGRILKEVRPLLHAAGIVPEPDFDDENSRKLRFATNDPGLIAKRCRHDWRPTGQIRNEFVGLL